MRVLGAVLAGGVSRRFGSDKALATLAGKSLIEHVFDRLAPQVDGLVVVGRRMAGVVSLTDRPPGGHGPLAGLAAALHYAETNDFNAVLTSACDLPELPRDLLVRLRPEAAVVAGQPLLGLWPVTLREVLDTHLAAGERSMRSWVHRADAREVDLGRIRNVNTISDLAAL